MRERNSRIKEFYKLSRDERLNLLRKFAGLSEQDLLLLNLKDNLEFGVAEQMIENMISVFPVPLGLATNFIINGKDYLVPLATEEASVIAAASNAAKLARTCGGFTASVSRSVMIGQVHVLNITNISQAKQNIEEHKTEILEFANAQDSVLVNLGGGAFDLNIREIESISLGKVLVLHILVDVKDAMGANVVNTMCEAIAPVIEKLTCGTVLLKILSNLAVNRVVKARAIWSKEELGSDLINKIIQANEIAKIDIFRAITHNKGIMNGIDAVCLATGNDFRAIESGVHGYAAMHNSYKPLTEYSKNESGNLVGTIEIPLVVGIVGGATKNNPFAKLCLKILDVKSASDLAQIIASVGLAQNFAALKALIGEGIQKGHMRLHLRSK
ncbi:MAG: hydroxymethylglutaryl-CoA reductase, degradative [Candidatus Babeliales bacterium]|jgi:hydroxymethylglutaryl-CoA reductase